MCVREREREGASERASERERERERENFFLRKRIFFSSVFFGQLEGIPAYTSSSRSHTQVA